MHVVLGGRVVDEWFGHLAEQVIDGDDDVEHLIARDHAVSVDVVQTERPLDLLLERAPCQHRQARHKVLRVQIKPCSLRVGAGREQVYSIYCHISLNIQQILIKFTPLVYCMNILQIVKFDLICIMVAMVTDKSLLSVNGFPIKQIPKNLLALQ